MDSVLTYVLVCHFNARKSFRSIFLVLPAASRHISFHILKYQENFTSPFLFEKYFYYEHWFSCLWTLGELWPGFQTQGGSLACVLAYPSVMILRFTSCAQLTHNYAIMTVNFRNFSNYAPTQYLRWIWRSVKIQCNVLLEKVMLI